MADKPEERPEPHGSHAPFGSVTLPVGAVLAAAARVEMRSQLGGRRGSVFREFREFISRGNVVDLAVGIIIGAAFTSVVGSLVNDIIMPPIGLALAGIDFANLVVTLSEGSYASLEDAQKAGAATWNYGKSINTIIHFMIVAFVIFMVVKQINRFRGKKDAAPAAPAAPPKSEVLLEEIRDLLKKG